MSMSAIQLLRQLSSGVRPPGVSATPKTGIEQTSFTDLLKKAQSGELVSKTPVTIASDAEIALSDDQLARLSFAADKLEAAGVRTALVSIDGQKLLLDISSRQVLGAATSAEGVYSGIDGVLDLGDARSDAQGANTAALAQTTVTGAAPTSGVPSNPTLLKLLSDLRTAG